MTLIILFVLQVDFIMAQMRDTTVFFSENIGAQLAIIAWENSPLKQLYESDVSITESELRISRLTWLDGLSVGSNINEFTINPPPDRNNFYPRSFTSRYKLYRLVYYENFHSIEEAIAREKQIKGGSRKKKVELINGFNPKWIDLSTEIEKW